VDEPLAVVEALPDSRLIVWSPEEGMRLYGLGFYGKPLGIAKPKEEFDAPLVLDPIEGVYLLEKGLIHDFDVKYMVYKDLRDRGFAVTPGIKYGCDFAVYEHGPGLDHAPFIVQVRVSGNRISAPQIVEAGRLATTVRKMFIIAVVEEEKVQYLGFKWWRP
jgi:tRNA-intron endonuclease